jgi:hypothetical protein
MDVLKSVGAVLLAGIVGVLPEASIQAQNPVRNVDLAV